MSQKFSFEELEETEEIEEEKEEEIKVESDNEETQSCIEDVEIVVIN